MNNIKINETVKTPNGPGTFQFYMWSEGQKVAAVAHKPDAQIDYDKCQGHMGDGRGMWILCTYPESEVSA